MTALLLFGIFLSIGGVINVKMQEHIIYGGAASTVVGCFWGPWNALVFWLASVLIDFDHYLDHVYRTGGGDWKVSSIFKMDAYCRRKLESGQMQQQALCLSLFHTVEVFAAVYAAAKYYEQSFFMFVFFGMVFHLFLDLLAMAQYNAVFVRALSLAEYMIRRALMKRRGINPDLFYREAFHALGIPTRVREAGRAKSTTPTSE